MSRALRILIAASTLTLLFMFFIEHVHAGKVRSPCILTPFEKALVNELTRFHQSSYLATQANIKKCVILEAATLIIHYENGHIGLFNNGDTMYVDSSQKQAESHNIKMPDAPHDVPEQYTKEKEKEANTLFAEFINIWHNSASSSDELSQADLVRADAVVQKMLFITPGSNYIFSVPGLRGNRYLALIEGHDSLSTGALLSFYQGYIDSDYRTRMEDLPTDDDKRAVIQKCIKIFETMAPHNWSFHTPTLLKEIKRIDPSSYVRLQELKVIAKDD